METVNEMSEEDEEEDNMNNDQAQNEPQANIPQPSDAIILDELAKLPEKTMVNKQALAQALQVAPRTIQRMVSRYELPPPISNAGRSVWFAHKVLLWFEAEAERQAQDAAREALKIRRYEA